jgi:AAA15 family ATPase/GTPase
MLKELHISNYRLFDDLTIPELGQVNLIAGKNNTGKTALLEAVRILVARGGSTTVNHLLKTRGEFTPSRFDSYDFLFPKNKVEKIRGLTLAINELKIKEKSRVNMEPRFSVEWANSEQEDLNPNITPNFPQDKPLFVPFSNENFPIQNLWKEIVLTPLEEEVIGILKIVVPNLRRIDVNDSNSKVLLEGDLRPVPLKSLGEGISRMLWLAVALVSAKKSMLLIDEFEAGLHHSVQEKLWERVFQYAKEWNIQVFVTTHSIDTVRAFHEVAERTDNTGVGKYFRLQRDQNGQIEVIGYNEEELSTALEFDLETR